VVFLLITGLSRVSTDKQGVRGYGIAAQRTAVKDYLDGGRWQLLGEFVEVESGKRKDRRNSPRRSRPAKGTRPG
jgi:DNA invertase Pin-like site-specific DNA recombinase